ncbi:hypothetical protein SAMN05428944_0076 [Streptomyces sp. 1222.5]|nr:hypothetical protein BX260_0073 [Streptomyces sp. 5112.2]SEB53260.1 hypothetical protein SAMN05428944_0076 [Streptomyces sp. 1222.5]
MGDLVNLVLCQMSCIDRLLPRHGQRPRVLTLPDNRETPHPGRQLSQCVDCGIGNLLRAFKRYESARHLDLVHGRLKASEQSLRVGALLEDSLVGSVAGFDSGRVLDDVLAVRLPPNLAMPLLSLASALVSTRQPRRTECPHDPDEASRDRSRESCYSLIHKGHSTSREHPPPLLHLRASCGPLHPRSRKPGKGAQCSDPMPPPALEDAQRAARRPHPGAVRQEGEPPARSSRRAPVAHATASRKGRVWTCLVSADCPAVRAGLTRRTEPFRLRATRRSRLQQAKARGRPGAVRSRGAGVLLGFRRTGRGCRRSAGWRAGRLPRSRRRR